MQTNSTSGIKKAEPQWVWDSKRWVWCCDCDNEYACEFCISKGEPPKPIDDPVCHLCNRENCDGWCQDREAWNYRPFCQGEKREICVHGMTYFVKGKWLCKACRSDAYKRFTDDS